jgi:hypothetical protein
MWDNLGRQGDPFTLERPWLGQIDPEQISMLTIGAGSQFSLFICVLFPYHHPTKFS